MDICSVCIWNKKYFNSKTIEDLPKVLTQFLLNLNVLEKSE